MRLIEVKERPRVFEEQTRIQSSESDAREEEVLALKHDVSFNRLPFDYCILLYYNCKLKWACFLVFIFYFYSSLIYIYLACESIRQIPYLFDSPPWALIRDLKIPWTRR